MNGIRWISRCAAVGVLGFVVSASAMAQFGGGKEQPGRERSVLVGDWAVEGAFAQDLCRCVGETDSPAVARIEEALRGPLRATGIEIVDAPLEEVVNLLQEDYSIPIQLDTSALDKIGLGPDEPVTVSLHNISLRSALRLMLKPLGVTYVIQTEVLLITSPEEADAHVVTCVYDVRDLVDAANERTFKLLIDAITGCVAPETWRVKGRGTGIRPLPPALLVVSQSQAVHEEIRGLLAAIREVRHERPAAERAAGDKLRKPEAAENDPFDF